MGFRKKYRCDKSKFTEGVWVPLGDKLQVRIGSMKSERYEEALQRALEPHRVALKTKSLPDELLEAAVVEALAEAVLLDWKGDEHPYSKQQAIAYLSDPEMVEFRDTVVALGKSYDLFRAEYEAEAEKNSLPA